MDFSFFQNKYVGIITGLAVFLGLLAFGIFANINSLLGVIGDISRVKQEITAAKEAHNNLGAMEKELKDYETRASEIDRRSIDIQIPRDYVKFLQEASLRQKVGLKIIATNAVQEEGGCQAIAFRAQVSGKFENAMSFLGELESNKWFSEISELNLAGQGSGQEVEMNILIKVSAQ